MKVRLFNRPPGRSRRGKGQGVPLVWAMILGCAACGGDATKVTFGSFRVSGTIIQGTDCAQGGSMMTWNTQFVVSPSADPGRALVTEEAFDCTISTVVQGGALDGANTSCPVTTTGFFSRQDFQTFRWEFGSREVSFAATVYGLDGTTKALSRCGNGTATAE